MNKKAEAKKLLLHYFRWLAAAAGVNWDSDSDAEIDALVEVLE